MEEKMAQLQAEKLELENKFLKIELTGKSGQLKT